MTRWRCRRHRCRRRRHRRLRRRVRAGAPRRAGSVDRRSPGGHGRDAGLSRRAGAVSRGARRRAAARPAARSLELFDSFVATRFRSDSAIAVRYRRSGTLDVALQRRHGARASRRRARPWSARASRPHLLDARRRARRRAASQRRDARPAVDPAHGLCRGRGPDARAGRARRACRCPHAVDRSV